MSVTELCGICERAEADRTCGSCGRLVCEKHFDEGVGLCVECASAGGSNPDPGSRALDRSDDPDLPDDVLR